MPRSNRRQPPRVSPSLKASLLMFAFGMAVLAFLVAIDRPHWFKLRPASGTAAAMWHGSAKEAPPEATVAEQR